MFFVICTGSPEYEISEDLIQLPCVADKVFGKPVTDMKNREETVNELASLPHGRPRRTDRVEGHQLLR